MFFFSSSRPTHQADSRRLTRLGASEDSKYRKGKEAVTKLHCLLRSVGYQLSFSPGSLASFLLLQGGRLGFVWILEPFFFSLFTERGGGGESIHTTVNRSVAHNIVSSCWRERGTRRGSEGGGESNLLLAPFLFSFPYSCHLWPGRHLTLTVFLGYVGKHRGCIDLELFLDVPD
jgi:hypothetical protein